MRDRLPEPGKENRVRITQDDGKIVEGVLSYADGATVQGSAYCKANVLPDDLCDALGLDRSSSEPKDALAVLGRITFNKAYTIPSKGNILRKEYITPRSQSAAPMAAVTTGGYALFGGGSGNSAIVDAYNTALTRTTATPLSTGRYSMGAAAVGNYALFAGS